MTTFHKLFTAMALVAVIGLVGCAKPTEAEKTKTADKTVEKTEPQKTAPVRAEEPKKVEPTPQNDNQKGSSGADAEAGSTEKKGGVDLPNEAEAGSTEKKGGVDVPKD